MMANIHLQILLLFMWSMMAYGTISMSPTSSMEMSATGNVESSPTASMESSTGTSMLSSSTESMESSPTTTVVSLSQTETVSTTLTDKELTSTLFTPATSTASHTATVSLTTISASVLVSSTLSVKQSISTLSTPVTSHVSTASHTATVSSTTTSASTSSTYSVKESTSASSSPVASPLSTTSIARNVSSIRISASASFSSTQGLSTAALSSATPAPSSTHVSTTQILPTTVKSIPVPSSSVAPTQKPGPKKYVFSFKITNKVCTTDIIENNVKSAEYKQLSNSVIGEVDKAFKSDPFYTGAKIVRFDCGSVIPVVEVSKLANATGTAANELKAVSDVISAGTFAGFSVSSFSSNPSAPSLPRVYFKIDSDLSNSQFCQHKTLFKEQFSNYVVTTDGFSLIKSSQIILYGDKCNDRSADFKTAKINVYISDLNSVEVNAELTNRAYKLVKQFADDGTTWRLSAAFDERVNSVELAGKDKKEDTALSEMTMVLVGMGVTFGVLLIIIVIIVICQAKRRKGRDDAITFENDAYKRAYGNEGFQTHQDSHQVNIDGHDYEYPDAAPGKTHGSPKGHQTTSYQQLQPALHQPQQYEPLTAEEEKEEEPGKMQVQPEDNEPFIVTVSSFTPEPRQLRADELGKRYTNNNLLKEEFQSLEYDMPTASIYPSQTLEKNRQSNVIPRPETRVSLQADPSVPNSDYINANHVTDFQSKPTMIVTQAPLQKTVVDFWRMVAEQNVQTIVMVTPLVQEGLEKCFQYWPPDSVARTYGDIQVQLSKKELKPDFTVTTMLVNAQGKQREVVLYRYMTWPETSIPENVKSFVTFLSEATKSNAAKPGSRLLVHCSDGVGMSAVFVAIANGMESLKEKNTVDVYSIVKRLRKDRAGAIERLDQYQFVYQALYECSLRLDNNQDDYVNNSDVTSSM